MANELDERRKMDRAARAQALVSDPLIGEFFERWEAALVEAWVAERDPVIRDRVWNLMQASRKLDQHLQSIISDGQVSAAILNEILGRPAA